MAAITATPAPNASTAASSTYSAPTYSPAVGELVALIGHASGSVPGTPTADDSLAGTFALAIKALKATSVDTGYIFIGNALATVTTARTAGVDLIGDSGTGAITGTVRLSGMAKVGALAIRSVSGTPQVGKTENTAAGTPTVSLPAAALTTNPILVYIGCADDTPVLTPPAGFTEAWEAGYTVPTQGGLLWYCASGFTGTTITSLTAVTGGQYLMIVVELDASGSTIGVNVGQASDASAAQPMGRSKAKAVGQVVDTSAAQPTRPAKGRVLGQPSGTSAAQPMGRAKAKAVGLATTPTQALGVTVRAHTRTLGLATSADLAAATGRSKAKAVGQSTGADVAVTVLHTGPIVIGLATSPMAALPVGRIKIRSIGSATSPTAAVAMSRLKRKALGQAVSADLATSMGRRKARGLGMPSETSTAPPLRRLKSHQTGIVVEVDLAQALGRRKARLLGQPAGVDAALAITRGGLPPATSVRATSRIDSPLWRASADPPPYASTADVGPYHSTIGPPPFAAAIDSPPRRARADA